MSVELIEMTVLIPQSIKLRLIALSEELGLLPAELAGLWLTTEMILRGHHNERPRTRPEDSQIDDALRTIEDG